MNYAESEALNREAARIRWRQSLMAAPGGVAWLRHVAGLYDHKERLLGPDHIGLPAGLEVMT